MIIGICDDVQEEREELEALLHKLDFLPMQIFGYESGESLLLAMEEDARFDLLILDIYMDGKNGMDIAKELRRGGRKVPILFLTNSAEFAVESYEVDASGYLMKPVSAEKLSMFLKKIFVVPEKRQILLRNRAETALVYLADIMWAEIDKHRINVHLQDGTEFFLKEKLDDFEARLQSPFFLRCHKSYLVNMDYIQEVGEYFILQNGSQIPIRVRERKRLTDVYYRYFIEKTMGDTKELLV